MGSVVTMSASVECGHKGVVAISSDAKLKVAGKAVLLKASADGKAVSTACTIKTDTSKGIQQCGKASVPGTLAQKLKAGGAPVLLEPLTGATDSKPAPGLPTVTGGSQTKLTAR